MRHFLSIIACLCAIQFLGQQANNSFLKDKYSHIQANTVKLDSSYQFGYNFDGTISSISRTKFYYNYNGIDTLRVIEANPFNVSWEPKSNRQTIPNKYGQDSIVFEQSWNRNIGKWNLLRKHEITYQNNQVVLDLRQYQDTSTGQWVNYYKEENQYFTDSLEAIRYAWNLNTSAWESLERLNKAYSNNLLVSESKHSYQNGSWNPVYRYRFEYNGQGQHITTTYYSGQTNPNQWNPSEKHEYTYDSIARVMEHIQLGWIIPTSSWNAYERRTFAYTVGTDSTTVWEVIYRGSTGNWVYDATVEWVSDNNYPRDQVIAPSFYGTGTFFQKWVIFDFLHKFSRVMRYYKGQPQSQLHPATETKHFYSDFNGSRFSIEEKEPLQLDLFPNPTREFITVKYESSSKEPIAYNIKDIKGSVMMVGYVLNNQKNSAGSFT